MKRILLLPYLLGGCIIIISCNKKMYDGNSDGSLIINEKSLSAHINTLASDQFGGRKPFTEGERKTIEYLRSEFTRLQLEPGNGNSFFQDVPMVKITAKAAPEMTVSGKNGNFILKGPEDFVIWTDKTDSVLSFNNDEVVFAGFGVVAPEYNWNDYANLDVKGKIVLVMVNDPGFTLNDSTLFKGKAMTWYGRWPYKYAEAARHGAKGCLIIHNTEAASYPFKVVQNNWNTSKLRLDNRGKMETYCDINGWISSDATKKLLEAAGKDTSILNTANYRNFKGEKLALKMSAGMTVTTEYNKSYNVIAKISGSKYPEETIIYTAHWDHLGIGAPDEKGDSIYNGAIDNGSGTAALIEMARAFKSLKITPQRTVVFLAVTAEEQGLWGSAYYAANPVFPLKKTVANINMDVLNWFGKTNDLVVIGRGQNELEDILIEELEKDKRVIAFDSRPESGSYYRSDHFNFAKVGVPAIDTRYGSDVIGKGKEYGMQKAKEYTTEHYHRPSDQMNNEFRFDGAVEDVKLLYRIGLKLSMQHTWPKWKTGSEFKAIREEQ